MIWLVWRRQRAALLLATALLAIGLVVLVVGRLVLIDRAAQLGASVCLTDPAMTCSEGSHRVLYDEFENFRRLLLLGLWALSPALGLIVGSGLFAREFEQHTDVLALTQAVSRRRWVAIGMTTMAVPLLAATLLLSLVNGWASEPYHGLYHGVRLTAPDFDVSGVAPAAEALTAFALAAGVGLVLRRSLVTVIVSVLGGIVLLFVSVNLRYDVLPDHIVTTPLDPDGNAVNSLPDGAVPRDYGFLDAAGTHFDPDVVIRSCDTPDYGSCLRKLGAVGQFQSYQPDTYYWPLQAVFAGAAAAIALLLVGAGLQRLRRR